MDSVENKVKNHMNSPDHVKYPDFEKMFSSIQRGELRVTDDISNRPQRRKTKAAIVIGLSAAIVATPVYAAIQYNWSDVLSSKQGIEAALKAGYGQIIEQSVTAHGVTLTVHTAFTDRNRTVLLYTLKPGIETEGQEIRYDQIALKDSTGKLIEGRYYQTWNADQGVYQGYFETDWVMEEEQSELQFTITDIRYLHDLQQEIDLDPADTDTQKFNIQKDGIGNVEVQSFKYAEGQVMINSAVTFTDPAVQEQTWARIMAYDRDENIITEMESPVYGTEGPTGEYYSRQIFNEQQFRQQGNRFTFVYTHEKERTDGTWSLKLSLSRQQMETGMLKKELDIPLHTLPGETSISGLVVTPTQIRVTLHHQEDYFRVPYRAYQLEVGGKVMDGYVDLEGAIDPNQTELRFENADFYPMDISSLADKPMTLIAKERVDEHAGSKASIRLTDISTAPQTITSNYEGYPIIWTYYSKDGNLYVESESPDNTFGGINQTYFLDGEEKQYFMPQFFNDSGNKHTDVYKNFNGTDLDLYVWNYTIKKPDEELRIPLSN